MRNFCRSYGRICSLPLPDQASIPMWTHSPVPTLRARLGLIYSKSFKTAHHIKDISDLFHWGSLIHSLSCRGDIYFCVTTCFHKIFVDIIYHTIVAYKAFEKLRIFFMPHPPHFFSRAICSHLIHSNSLPSFFPAIEICNKSVGHCGGFLLESKIMISNILEWPPRKI